MEIIIDDDFDLDKISMSGQCFRVRKLPDGSFRFITGASVLYIKRLSETVYSVSCDQAEWDTVWHPYFDLDRNYRAIRASVPADDVFMNQAAADGAGIRILRQDAWEMLVTFIISQRKSIPAIQQSVELLASRFGSPYDNGTETVLLFPSPAQLNIASKDDLVSCKLGYRVPYIMDAVSFALSHGSGFSAFGIYKDEDLFNLLMRIKGVGIKVASCVCLFGFGRTALAPVDTWISKVIDSRYNGRNPFPDYGNAAGIMQQYAFYSAQQNKAAFRGKDVPNHP